MTTATKRTTGTEVFTFETTSDLASLRGPWKELAGQSDNVFATYEWLSTWWRHFGRNRPLLLTTVRDDRGELIAILPLYLATRRPLRVVRLIGHGATDQLGPVCAAVDRHRAAHALAVFVTEHLDGRWDLAIADELPCAPEPLGTAHLLDRSPTHVVSLGSTGTTADAWLASRSAKLRAQLARSGRKLERLGAVTYRTADDPATVAADLDLLMDLHRQRWDPVGGSRSYAGREAFHHDIARTFLDRGWLRLRFLEVDGVAVAAAHSFRFAGAESHYQGGRDPAFDSCSVGLLLQRHAIRSCADEGVAEYRFLRGDESYKRRLADHTVTQHSVAWARGPLGATVRAAIAGLPRLTRTQARWVPAPLAWGTGGTPRWGAP